MNEVLKCQNTATDSSLASENWNPDEMDEDPNDISITAAELLPSGWVWKIFNDGSGSLISPEGKHHFGYDLSPYRAIGAIEYQKTNSHWSVFEGSFYEYQKFAESQVAAELLRKGAIV